jgi:hypothetical protein
MDENTRPSEVYIINATNIFDEYNYDLDGLANEQEEPKKDGATTQFLNITTTIIQNVGIENHDEHEQLNVKYYFKSQGVLLPHMKLGRH